MKRPLATTGDQDSSDSEEVDTEDIEAASPGSWKQKDPGLVGTNIPCRQKVQLSEEVIAAARDWNTAYDYYKLFQPDSFADLVVEQSKLYGIQEHMPKAAAAVNENVYR